MDYAIKILGANLDFASGNVLFTTTKSNYLSRGHLAPDAGFIYDSFQDATYYFINVAPQFQSFNNGNWRMLEDKIRRYGDESVFTVCEPLNKSTIFFSHHLLSHIQDKEQCRSVHGHLWSPHT